MASNSAPPSPIVFKARGMKPDVCLEVFGTEFHVHSVVLKLHSHFFYTFFDSADKDSTGAGGAFKYEWVTKVLDNGKDWQLVCKGPKAGDLAVKKYRGGKKQQTAAFWKLMSAFYNQIFSLQNPTELFTITSLARFYVALPVLSHSLYAAFRQSESSGMIQDISGCAPRMISTAIELRHLDLFRDSITLTIGHWNFDLDIFLTNDACRQSTKLRKAIKNSYNELRTKISKVHQEILKAQYNTQLSWEDAQEIGEESIEVMKDMKDMNNAGQELVLPEYFRRLYNIESSPKVENALREAIEPLLANNLVLPRLASWVERNQNSYFFCVTIDDEDLPWDATQTEW